MKHIFLFNCMVIGGLLPFATSVIADNDPAHMKELCREHGRKVVGEIHRKVFDRMTEEQYRQTESLIIDNCLHRFASGKNNEAITNSGTVEERNEDWFTRYVLEGEGADKPGNRRLERMRRK